MQDLPYNQSTLEKLQTILKCVGYDVRFEKGNFNTGFCLLENTKTIVINKFSTLDAKINAMAEMLKNLEIAEELITDDKLKKVLHILQQTKLQL
jgi:hypothetical protein